MMNEQPGFADDPQVREAQRIALLIAGYIRQTLTRDEHDELDEWVAASDENMLLFEQLTDETQVQQALDWLGDSDAPERLKKLKGQLSFARNRRHLFSKIWHYAVAASLVIIAGSIVFILSTKKPGTPAAPGITARQQGVLPGGDKAILTLSDGSMITLEQAKDGTLAMQGSSLVVKRGGQLVYNTAGKTPNTQLFNTVTVPRGGSYSLTLSDGTHIWLNAASSIRFPAAFTGSERRVAITGEVYFEVAKNSAMPFKAEVKDRDMVVEVLGTHFNINAYPDEADIQTTLLEGSVKVLSGPKKALLKPGQQAQLDAAGNWAIAAVNTEEAIAWKNGLFQFSNTDISTLMRQLARWYDIDVIYEGNKTADRFGGTISRNVNLTEVLQILELSKVHFKLDGKKLIVLP